jgi:formylglycine-generating enzyme required for sulfatase activity
VHGNLSEWCLDGLDGGFYARCPIEDPMSDASGSQLRAVRGGDFHRPATTARSARRGGDNPDYADRLLGLRPARPLHAP